MEAKGLRVNAGKVIWCTLSRVRSEASEQHSCGVCRTGVVSNSILCIVCFRWAHKRCSVDFRCRKCSEEGPVGTVSQRERGREREKS